MGHEDAADEEEPTSEELERRRLTAHLFGPSHWFPDDGQGGFQVLLAEDGRQLVGRVVADLRDLLLTSDPVQQRLYPTAYPDDPGSNDEWAEHAHDQLLMARLEGLDIVERTLSSERLTLPELTAWLQAINEARLVLGTRLDVTEDDPRDDDPDHPDAPGLALYHLLGRLVGDIVDALYGQLPPPSTGAGTAV